MTAEGTTHAERLQHQLEQIRNRDDVGEIRYSRVSGVRIARLGRGRPGTGQVQRTGPEVQRLEELIDPVAVALAYRHLRDGLKYDRDRNRLTVESSEQAVFQEHFRLPLEDLRRIILQAGPTSSMLAGDLTRRISEAAAEIPGLMERLWRDTAHDLRPLGFELGETGNPWRKSLEVAEATAGIVETDGPSAGDGRDTGLPGGSHRALEHLAGRMFGARLEGIAHAINARLEEDGIRPPVRTDTVNSNMEQKMDLMALAQWHFRWEGGRVGHVPFDREPGIWDDIMTLHPTVAQPPERD